MEVIKRIKIGLSRVAEAKILKLSQDRMFARAHYLFLRNFFNKQPG